MATVFNTDTKEIVELSLRDGRGQDIIDDMLGAFDTPTVSVGAGAGWAYALSGEDLAWYERWAKREEEHMALYDLADEATRSLIDEAVDEWGHDLEHLQYEEDIIYGLADDDDMSERLERLIDDEEADVRYSDGTLLVATDDYGVRAWLARDYRGSETAPAPGGAFAKEVAVRLEDLPEATRHWLVTLANRWLDCAGEDPIGDYVPFKVYRFQKAEAEYRKRGLLSSEERSCRAASGALGGRDRAGAPEHGER